MDVQQTRSMSLNLVSSTQSSSTCGTSDGTSGDDNCVKKLEPEARETHGARESVRE